MNQVSSATSQRAVQLVGPDALTLNAEKPIPEPGPHQLLCRVEVVGLCFSDLKLLKQFSGHARKSDILRGIDLEVLKTIPGYVPGDAPTVPGHETVVRIEKVGDQVTGFAPGERYLVQTDYRWLATEDSNAAFGYNFEGALQEFVLLDQRVITSPEGESMLIPAEEALAASAVALVEPWACVEDSYAVKERQELRAGGRLLVVAPDADAETRARAFLASAPSPASTTWIGEGGSGAAGEDRVAPGDAASLPDESFDDILFLSADADLLEVLFGKIAIKGLVNVVLNGRSFGRPVVVPVGRVHYGGIRLTGTSGGDPSKGYARIPASGELREGDTINIVGAGGPMGTMHVIRDVCQGVAGTHVYAGDLSEERLAALEALTRPLAERAGIGFATYHAKDGKPAGPFGYTALMVPVPALVAVAVEDAADGGIINIFAGIPAHVSHPLDLDAYVRKGAYFIGTSGSDLEDMKIVLGKVTDGRLDTNLSVAAVSGLDGAVEGIRAVEQQQVPGKIVVYPTCRGLGLTLLDDLAGVHPEVAALLDRGHWCSAAEKKLLELYA